MNLENDLQYLITFHQHLFRSFFLFGIPFSKVYYTHFITVLFRYKFGTTEKVFGK